jgi:hypothetical protein
VHEYLDTELSEMLKSTVNTKQGRREAVSFIHRRANQQFFSSLLGQLVSTMHRPILLRVGRDLMKDPIKFVVLSPNSCNDNEECYTLCGCNMRSINQRCRICSVSSLNFQWLFSNLTYLPNVLLFLDMF